MNTRDLEHYRAAASEPATDPRPFHRCAGDGTICQLPSGSWRVRVPFPGGKRVSRVAPTREEAERIRQQLAHGAEQAGLADALPEPAPHPGAPVVYFVRATNGRVKIGTTTNLSARLASLRCAIECELLAVVPGDARVESAVHKRFASWRVHGEWFQPGRDLLAYIERLRWGR